MGFSDVLVPALVSLKPNSMSLNLSRMTILYLYQSKFDISLLISLVTNSCYSQPVELYYVSFSSHRSTCDQTYLQLSLESSTTTDGVISSRWKMPELDTPTRTLFYICFDGVIDFDSVLMTTVKYVGEHSLTL